MTRDELGIGTRIKRDISWDILGGSRSFDLRNYTRVILGRDPEYNLGLRSNLLILGMDPAFEVSPSLWQVYKVCW